MTGKKKEKPCVFQKYNCCICLFRRQNVLFKYHVQTKITFTLQISDTQLLYLYVL